MALARNLSSLGRWCLNTGPTTAPRIVAAMLRLQEPAGQSVLHMPDSSFTSACCSSSHRSLASLHVSAWQPSTSQLASGLRTFATTPNDSKEATAQSQGESSAPNNSEEAAADAEAQAAEGTDEQKARLEDMNKQLAEMQEKAEDAQDKLLRSLADMENLRQRTAREVENTQKYAVQKFVKSLLDVADTLERAYESVPEAVRKGEAAEMDPQKTTALLKSVVDGVQMTSSVLLNVLKQHGVEQYYPLNEKFDPNLHNALFEVPDPSKEAGSIAVVTKRGYRMHDRVVRPAEVGVVKAPAA